MPYLFTDEYGNDTAGRVVILESGNDDLPQYVEISKLIDSDNPPDRTGLIVTGSSGSRRAAAQIQPTLGNSLYAIGFGQRPGMFSVTGMAFTEICGNDEGDPSTPQELSGLITLLRFFDTYNRGQYRELLTATLQPGLVRYAQLDSLDWRYTPPPFRMIEYSLGLILLP